LSLEVRMALGSDLDRGVRSQTVAFQPLAITIDRCKGCQLCIGACPKACLELDTGPVNALGHHPIRLADAAACTSCALCARVCPDAVFTIYARPKVV
jgi:2-oxoglutarate ferredoxin oxidoreductase subunit delta